MNSHGFYTEYFSFICWAVYNHPTAIINISCLLGFNLALPLSSTYMTKNIHNPLAFVPRQDNPHLPGTSRKTAVSFGWIPRCEDDLSQWFFMVNW